MLHKLAQLLDSGAKETGERLPSDPTEFARLKVLNKQVVSARQAAEWGMRALQGSFGLLKLPLPASNHKAQAKITHLAVCLHQLWCQSVGINQTATVYQDVEKEFHLLTRDMIFTGCCSPKSSDAVALAATIMAGFKIKIFFSLLVLILSVGLDLICWA
jgi:hypothetical protein